VFLRLATRSFAAFHQPSSLLLHAQLLVSTPLRRAACAAAYAPCHFGKGHPHQQLASCIRSWLQFVQLVLSCFASQEHLLFGALQAAVLVKHLSTAHLTFSGFTGPCLLTYGGELSRCVVQSTFAVDVSYAGTTGDIFPGEAGSIPHATAALLCSGVAMMREHSTCIPCDVFLCVVVEWGYRRGEGCGDGSPGPGVLVWCATAGVRGGYTTFGFLCQHLWKA
jgi:hypothetical protein